MNVLRSLLLFAAAALILPGAAGAAESQGRAYGELSVEQVQQLVESKGADVFDNNSRESWVKGHVPGARWVAFDAVRASDLPQDKARKLVFYCASRH